MRCCIVVLLHALTSGWGENSERTTPPVAILSSCHILIVMSMLAESWDKRRIITNPNEQPLHLLPLHSLISIFITSINLCYCLWDDLMFITAIHFVCFQCRPSCLTFKLWPSHALCQIPIPHLLKTRYLRHYPKETIPLLYLFDVYLHHFLWETTRLNPLRYLNVRACCLHPQFLRAALLFRRDFINAKEQFIQRPFSITNHSLLIIRTKAFGFTFSCI